MNYTSIDVIADRILKHPLLKNMNYEDIISHTVDVLRLINVPRSYVEKSCYQNIVEYKAVLPDEALKILTVDYMVDDYPCPMKMATDTLNNHLDKLENTRDSGLYTYSLNGCVISTNQQEGILFVTYSTLVTDDNGVPMIPDNVSVIKAIENYIKVQLFTIMYDLQKIGGGSLERAEQEYNWYIGKAQSQFQGLYNDDEIESFLADFKRLFIINNDHRNRSMYNNIREIRYKNG